MPKQTNLSYDNFTNEQKILFEICLLVHLLEEANPELTSIYSYPDKISDIEKCKIILYKNEEIWFHFILVYFKTIW